MRAGQARIEQLEGELGIARRELDRVNERDTAAAERLRKQATALETLRSQLQTRNLRIEDLESQLAAQRIAPNRIGPTTGVSERRRRKAAAS